MRPALLVAAAFLLAGCAASDTAPEAEAEDAPAAATWTHETHIPRGVSPAVHACVRPGIPVCNYAPPAVAEPAFGFSSLKYNLKPNVTDVRLKIEWNASSPATETLRLKVGLDRPDEIEWLLDTTGPSPIEFRVDNETLSGSRGLWVNLGATVHEEAGPAEAEAWPAQGDIDLGLWITMVR